MKPRPDLLDADSPRGLEVIQLTTEAIPSSHIYMEAQIFTPDARKLVLHRSAHPHGSDQNDPEHRYLLCDLEDGCKFSPLTQEVGPTGPSISPDGQWFYYFVNQTRPGGGSLTLKRVHLDGTGRETIAVVDAPLRGTNFRPSRIYPLSTISSDGKRIAISAFMGDGQTDGAPWGLLVFDIPSGTASLVIEGISWCNMHPQYSRAQDPTRARDILIQENHGNVCNAQGDVVDLVAGLGADIHVLRDDGQAFRNLPWGRDGVEQCQGHQCWRGRSDWAITSTGTVFGPGRMQARLIESQALPHADHNGLQTKGSRRNDLSREVADAQFFHFATDIAGKRFITDTGPSDHGGGIYVAEMGEPGREPLRNLRRLLWPHSSWSKAAHMHPFLSPDGKAGFFNSDESGLLQAFMVRGY